MPVPTSMASLLTGRPPVDAYWKTCGSGRDRVASPSQVIVRIALASPFDPCGLAALALAAARCEAVMGVLFLLIGLCRFYLNQYRGVKINCQVDMGPGLVKFDASSHLGYNALELTFLAVAERFALRL